MAIPKIKAIPDNPKDHHQLPAPHPKQLLPMQTPRPLILLPAPGLRHPAQRQKPTLPPLGQPKRLASDRHPARLPAKTQPRPQHPLIGDWRLQHTPGLKSII